MRRLRVEGLSRRGANLLGSSDAEVAALTAWLQAVYGSVRQAAYRMEFEAKGRRLHFGLAKAQS